jgi:hypothetical protein
MKEGSLLLALNDIKNIVDDVTRTILSNYVLPEDPIIRFLEYGLKLSERNVKIAHWLITQYKGTPHAIWALEELSEYEDNGKYYKQIIRFRDVKWQINELYIPDNNTESLAQTSEGYIRGQYHTYIPQIVASYNMHLHIIFVYSRVVTSAFIQYLYEYLSHVILVNNISIIIEHYILELEPIQIIANRLYRGAIQRRYIELKVAKKWYS